jgi:hypothetical protein
MSLPAGDHLIDFRFEPKSFKTGNTVSFWSSLMGWLLLIAAVAWTWREWDAGKKGGKTA